MTDQNSREGWVGRWIPALAYIEIANTSYIDSRRDALLKVGRDDIGLAQIGDVSAKLLERLVIVDKGG